MRFQSKMQVGFRPRVAFLLGLTLMLLASALPASELTCENGENQEGGCCCFLKAHTYRFEPVTAAKVHVTFDTGRGINCSSQVAIQVLSGADWKTVQTVNANSSSGRSEMNRLSGTLMIGDTISGVRVDDGGRCYIDYSKVGVETSGPVRGESAAASRLRTGTYRVEAHSDRAYTSTWRLEVAGERIVGSSDWDCCPGRRTDPLEGWVRGDQVKVARSCGGQGVSGRCLQVFDGKISGDRVEGTWTHNDRFAGWWGFDLTDLGKPTAEAVPTGADKPGLRLIADPPPPYGNLPVTIDFVQRPEPVPGAVWWLDGRRMTNADIFFWTFGDRRNHEVELRDARGERLAKYEVSLGAPRVRKIKIVADKEPPYHRPVSVTFRQEPQPMTGARWFLDGRRISDAEAFTWRFDAAGDHRVVLKSSRGDVLAERDVKVTDRRAELPATYRLWGKRSLVEGSERAQTDTRELELDRSAAVLRVEGSAESFCIWTVGAGGSIDRRVLCGSQAEPIVGAILLPGRYMVLPDLAEGKDVSAVTVLLRPR